METNGTRANATIGHNVPRAGLGRNARGIPDIIAGEEKFYRSKVAEKILDVSVVEYPLQFEAIRNRGVHCARGTPARLAAQIEALIERGEWGTGG